MEKIGGFYINRAKSIITRTSNIGLIFLFTLTYVWYKSVFPNKELIGKIVTQKEKSLYFDSVYKFLKKSDSIGFKKLYNEKLDTLNERIKQQYEKLDTLNERIEQQFKKKNIENRVTALNANRILRYDTSFEQVLSRRKEKFNKAILPIKNKTDSINRKLQDSLSHAQFEMQVPTLSSVKTDYNFGFPIWMFLTTFFLLYMSTNRNLIVFYLKKGLNIYSKDYSSDKEMNHLDIQLPFWMYPLIFDSRLWRGRIVYDIINNSRRINKMLITGILIFFVLYMELETVKLVWNINNIGIVYKERLFAQSFFSQVFVFVLFAISCMVCILWFFPYRLNFLNNPEEKTDFYDSRRKLLKYSLIGGGVFFLQFAPFSAVIPKIKSASFNYRRKKPANRKNIKTNLSGFYINDKGKTIHYFSDEGTSLTLRTVPTSSQKKFIERLKPINIFDYLDELKTSKVTFPHSVWPLDIEAGKFLKKNEFLKAFQLLELGIKINFYGNSNNRLLLRIKKELKRNGYQLKNKERIYFQNLLPKKESNKFEKYIKQIK